MMGVDTRRNHAKVTSVLFDTMPSCGDSSFAPETPLAFSHKDSLPSPRCFLSHDMWLLSYSGSAVTGAFPVCISPRLCPIPAHSVDPREAKSPGTWRLLRVN